MVALLYDDETAPQAMLLLVLFVAFFSLLHLTTTKQRQRRAAATTTGSSSDNNMYMLRQQPPPSPPGLPVIGHLHLIGFLPHVSLRGLHARYGRDGVMLVRLGSVPTLVVSSPHAAEAVMRTHDHLLASRPPSTSARALLNGSLDVAFAAYGEHWRQAKKLLTSHLLTVRKVQSYRAGREEEVRLLLAEVRGAAAAGRAVDMSDLLYGFTTDVMCRAVSGRFFKVGGRTRLFRDLLDATAALIGGFNAEDYFPWLLRVGVFKRSIYRKADKVRKRWDDLLDRVIDDHEGKLVQQREPDFIEILLSHQQEHGLNRDHIKALLIDIFFGGTDTSYIVLEFVMAELLRHPRVMSTLQAEIRSGVPDGQEMVTEDDLAAGLPYLKAVIKETLRLHPPAPLLAPHFSTTVVHVDGGYKVPANIPILVNAWALGRDREAWTDDAEEFRPERFMHTDVSFKGNDYHFLPFGAGRRICPGMNFSISTLEIVVANLMYAFNWDLPVGTRCIDMTEMFWLTVHRKKKLILVPEIHI